MKKRYLIIILLCIITINVFLIKTFYKNVNNLKDLALNDTSIDITIKHDPSKETQYMIIEKTKNGQADSIINGLVYKNNEMNQITYKRDKKKPTQLLLKTDKDIKMIYNGFKGDTNERK